jgi:DNA-binding MarR family transcriptional regulator
VKTPSRADVIAALHRFGLERDRLRTALARRLGIAVADLDALEHLELAGPLSQRELAERLLLSSGAVTFLVDRLEQAGLVGRQPHPTDRRTTLVGLRPGAELPEVPELEQYHQASRRAASQLSAAGRAAVTGFLSAVTADAAQATTELQRRARARSRRTGSAKE